MQDRSVRIILASRSGARAEMLASAGLVFDACPADLDETAVKDSMLAEGNAPVSIARTLAGRKALQVSTDHPDALVIGADQLLAFDGTIFSKARSRAEACEQLKTLRGKSHSLISAVSLARGGALLWQHDDSAMLEMRNISDAYLADYLDQMGDSIFSSVGGYQLEGLGSQLFSAVRGDYFTVLGMPLLPLLAALRQHGALAS